MHCIIYTTFSRLNVQCLIMRRCPGISSGLLLLVITLLGYERINKKAATGLCLRTELPIIQACSVQLQANTHVLKDPPLSLKS